MWLLLYGVDIRNGQTYRELLWVYLGQTDNCQKQNLNRWENAPENGIFAAYPLEYKEETRRVGYMKSIGGRLRDWEKTRGR